MADDVLKKAAIDFMTLVAQGKVSEAYECHVAAGFRHHNPNFPGDAASLKKAMQDNADRNPDKVLEIQRTLREGDLVAIFSRVRQTPDDLDGALVHIFRFENDRIAELWDIGQAVPANMANENGMF